jgi:hypothetical protein
MRSLEAQYCASAAWFGGATQFAQCERGDDGMTQATEDERRLVMLLADRLALAVPAAAVAGVVANQRLLARHHEAVRAALTEDAR